MAGLDLRATIERLGRVYTVLRPGTTTYVDGHPSAPAPSQVEAKGVVFPADENTMQRLEEGDRTARAVGFITTSEIRSSTPGGSSGDRLVYQGAEWEARYVLPYIEDGQFFDCVMVRVGQ